MDPLPIDPLLPGIVAALSARRGLVLVAPPGAGKTTRVPRALYDAKFADAGEIVVLEPRRLAARMAARRVADELGSDVGGVVGYTMRFEDVSSAATRIRFVTEGTLTRRLLSDGGLRGVSTVVLDEVHERSLQGDLAIALLRRLQLGARPDLSIVAMSATVDAAPFASFLGAEILRAEGRRFDVATTYAEKRDERRLEQQVASAVKRLIADGVDPPAGRSATLDHPAGRSATLDGDVLVFLPGGLEIRRAAEALAPVAREHDLLILPLHGSLSPAEQDRAVRRADRRKVVLATNVAETSVTIDGVVAVVDSGLARVASHAAWSGLPTLVMKKIAKAAAEQRAGRAGRTRPGVCVRLYTKGDFDARPSHEASEVARADLAEAALELASSGADPTTFGWFEAPPPASLEAALTLLRRLGAMDAARRITKTGRRMLTFPLHPRLARLVVEAERRGVGRDGAAIAALVAERDTGSPNDRDRDGSAARHGSDVFALLERFESWTDPRRPAPAARAVAQVRRMVDRSASPPVGPEAHDRALGLAVLAGFPDRVGRLRHPANAVTRTRAAREVVFAAGGTAALAPQSAVDETDLVIAVDVEERREGEAGTAVAVVRVAHATDVDALIEQCADDIVDEDEATWNASAERVDRVRRMRYGALILEETRGGVPKPEAAARVLAEAVRARGVRAFLGDATLDGFVPRVAFAKLHAPELDLPDLDEAGLSQSLDALCEGATSFADLRALGLASRVKHLLTAAQARAVDALAPEAVTLAHGRHVRLVYPPGQAPRAASRLQDFFGMREGPRVARGKVPVTLELLAPNKRAVQVTTDLAGFWSKHYPAIAKELRRKYPRHAWPDDPLA